MNLVAIEEEVHRRLLAEPGSDVDGTVERLALEVAPLLHGADLAAVVDRVVARVRGLGPLEALLAEPGVTEIMVNDGGRAVWVEQAGRLVHTGLRLEPEVVTLLIERAVAPLGRRADRVSPIVDARLPDGARLHAIVPPLAVDGPCLTIRRFSARPVPLTAFASDEVVTLLSEAVWQGANILVSGPTAAGKTTLLNALVAEASPVERIITIEDAAELQLPGEHVVRLEARPPTADGVGEVTMRELVRAALRMRPDRLVVGEVRGPEALDMVMAMSTGHDGSLATCHANGPLDALRRVEVMVLQGGIDLPLDALRELVQSAIDLVVHVERGHDGRRQVASVAEVAPPGELGERAQVVGDSTRVLASRRRQPRRSVT